MATSTLVDQKSANGEGSKLAKKFCVFASCANGTIYQMYPQREDPVYEALKNVASERRNYGIVGIICSISDYIHYVGLALTVNNTRWPPAAEGWSSLFNGLFMRSNTVSGDSWMGNFWLANIGVGVFLGSMVAVCVTDYLARENFSWKFGTSSAGIKVGMRIWALVIRVYFFAMGIPLFVTFVRPYITAFDCNPENEYTACWGFEVGHAPRSHF